MPVKHKSIIAVDKWTIIGGIVGGIWGLISAILCIVAGLVGSTGDIPPIIFMILTLPGTIVILLVDNLDIDVSGTLIVLSIPIVGIVIGILISILISNIYKNKNRRKTNE